MGTEISRRELHTHARWSSIQGEERVEYTQAIAELDAADTDRAEVRAAHAALDALCVPPTVRADDGSPTQRLAARIAWLKPIVLPAFLLLLCAPALVNAETCADIRHRIALATGEVSKAKKRMEDAKPEDRPARAMEVDAAERARNRVIDDYEAKDCAREVQP